MTIRAATSKDLPAIRQCAEAAYEKYVGRMGRKPAPMIADFAAIEARGCLYVLDTGGGIAGFIVFYPMNGAMHLENVAVLPCAHGKGYGSRLIDFAERAAREQGFTRIELYTNEKMTENFTYYERRGYIEIGRREEDGFKRVFYQKPLSNSGTVY